VNRQFEETTRQLVEGSLRKRLDAIHWLADSKDERADAALLAALGDQSRTVRATAISALIERDPGRRAEPIVTALRAGKGDAPAPYVPPDGLEILKLGLTKLKSVEPVEKLIADAIPSDRAWVRMLAARELGSIGDGRAVEPLIGLLADEVGAVRRAAIIALGQLRDPRALDALRGAIAREGFATRRHVRRAVRKIETAGRGG
jgi:HEAT repeat protein